MDRTVGATVAAGAVTIAVALVAAFGVAVLLPPDGATAGVEVVRPTH